MVINRLLTRTYLWRSITTLVALHFIPCWTIYGTFCPTHCTLLVGRTHCPHTHFADIAFATCHCLTFVPGLVSPPTHLPHCAHTHTHSTPHRYPHHPTPPHLHTYLPPATPACTTPRYVVSPSCYRHRLRASPTPTFNVCARPHHDAYNHTHACRLLLIAVNVNMAFSHR